LKNFTDVFSLSERISSHFPDLPEQNPPWPDNIVQGHVAVKEVYENGVQLGRQDEASLSRLEVGQVCIQELDNLFVQMGVAQDGSVRHEPVACEPALSPFPSAEIASAFNNRWHFVSENGITPSGFGLLPDELGPEGYPSIQTLRIGRRGGSVSNAQAQKASSL
jgi:hypothetical protein